MKKIISRFYCLPNDNPMVIETYQEDFTSYIRHPHTVILFLVNKDDSFEAYRILPRPSLILRSLFENKHYSDLNLEDPCFKRKIISYCSRKPEHPENIYIKELLEDLDSWKKDPVVTAILNCCSEN